jgi:hypothetical protein
MTVNYLIFVDKQAVNIKLCTRVFILEIILDVLLHFIWLKVCVMDIKRKVSAG